jgi:hypothetical protein
MYRGGASGAPAGATHRALEAREDLGGGQNTGEAQAIVNDLI